MLLRISGQKILAALNTPSLGNLITIHLLGKHIHVASVLLLGGDVPLSLQHNTLTCMWLTSGFSLEGRGWKNRGKY